MGLGLASFPQKLRPKPNKISFLESSKRVSESTAGTRSDTERKKFPLGHPILFGEFSEKF
jgi:hypothetical protein